MFTDSIKNFSKHKAVVTDLGQQLTYHELHGQASQLFEKVRERCLVFCLCKNCVESLVGYVSFLSNRIVPVMLDASLKEEMLNGLVEIYKPRYVWLPIERCNELKEYYSMYSQNEYVLLRSKLHLNAEIHDSLALLLTTSGSTGSPKLVRLSYENVFSNARSIAMYLSINPDERPITTLPMHYTFGLSVINSHLIQGATILLTDRSLMEKEFWQFLKNEKATSLSGVPYTYEILKKLRFFKMDLPSLRTLTQAGGRLSIELQKEFAEYCLAKNKRFFVMYGQTEATARMSYLPYERVLEKLGSIGIAIPGGEFSLKDENGILITESGRSGELVYKGSNVSLGYAESADDLKKGDDNNGILYTGDISQRDNDNFFYIVGREKRFIKVFGNRVNLDETEQLLKSFITDCACIGTDDHMVIYITENGREEDVKKFISAKTGLNHSVFDIRYCESIPKNSSGKTLYTNLAL
ncbi:MAG TPA: AMP-binding protein [Bacteroidales bacterium]|nr:AMP-binding protein [Bacteroidales bacterium]